jgi:hypothetical protein
MNFFPEIAPRFWIDPGRRLVQQQQLRAMNETGREREPLFPSAGKLAGQLLLAFREPELFDALAHCLTPLLHAIHARDEIEILFNAQILPKTESLRHVTDFALDRFTLGDHIVTENAATSGISAKYSAEHSQKRGLAAPVRSEKSENFAGAHGKIDMIHRSKLTEPLGHSAHLDDVFAVFHFDSNSTSTG